MVKSEPKLVSCGTSNKPDFLNRVRERLIYYFDLVPPRHFWPVFIRFLRYGEKQALYAARYRDQIDASLESHFNFKRAHYLEKAISLKLPRGPERDSIFKTLKSYVASPTGLSDPCLPYLNKIMREYAAYPNDFQCFMQTVPFEQPSPEAAEIVRRVIVQRRSIRQFQPEPVAAPLIEQVVEAGRYAPSSCNAQPLALVSTTDRQTIDVVFGAALGARDWRAAIPTAIVVAVDRRHYKPFEQHLVMAQDVAAATQNMLLMAHALGLAACWVSLISDMHMQGQRKVYSQLQLPPYIFVGAAIAIGYPVSAVCEVPRRSWHQVWFRERFAGNNDASV